MKITRRQLRQIIKEAIDSDGDGALNADELRDLADNLEDDIDPNIQKIENIVYSLPNVTRDNFELNIQHDPEYSPGEYEVFHSEYAMSKLASLAGLRMSHEITSMFEDSGFEVSETWSSKEPIVLIDPKVPR